MKYDRNGDRASKSNLKVIQQATKLLGDFLVTIK